MKLSQNIIALRNGLVCPPDNGMDNRIHVSTIQAHLMQYKQMLDEDAFLAMSKADLSWLTEFNNDVITYLKDAMGGRKSFKPLYANFPQEVMSMSDYELYFNAIRHYWSDGAWVPTSASFEKEVKFENVKYTMLKPTDEVGFDAIFTNLVKINTSLTPVDMAVVKWFVESGRTLVFPEVIPFKENLCTLAAMRIPGLPVKTVTDVLRIAVHMSGGDISLPAVPAPKVKLNRWSNKLSSNPARDAFKFKKFKRADRKYILGLLEQSNCDVKEMALRDQRWLRLGEILHPGEYKKLFPKSYNAFDKLRNQKVVTWYGQVEQAFKVSLEAGLEKLAERPGEFVRRMDALLRKNPFKTQVILDKFAEISKKSSNKVLFEIYSHFENRRNESSKRSVFIKGARKKTELPTLAAMNAETVEAVHSTIFSSLKEKFTVLPSLGNVWIDEKLKNVPLPSNMRSMDFSMKPTIRGTRIPFDNLDAKVIRAFVHWDGPTDIDLSATFINPSRKCSDVVSFHNLRTGYSAHSGDVRHRSGPCAEYIDIDLAESASYGWKYAIIDVRNYDGNGLEKVGCVFGMMERQYPESNDNWLPETVSNAHKLGSTSTNTIVAALDLETREYIMLDLDSAGLPVASHDTVAILKAIETYMHPPAISVYDLLTLHTEARGRLVTLDNNVDTYFKFEDFVNSYQQTGEYMGI